MAITKNRFLGISAQAALDHELNVLRAAASGARLGGTVALTPQEVLQILSEKAAASRPPAEHP
jgi:hypothetical protein